MADVSREQFSRIIQHGFNQGVNNRLQADLLQPNQLVEMKNGQVITSTLRRRPGIVDVFSAATGLSTEFQPVALQTVRLPKGERLVALVNVGRSSSKMLVFDGADAGPITVTGSYTFSEDADLVVFGDRLYVLDPTAPPVYWEAGATTLHEDEGGIRGAPHGVAGAFFQFRGYILDGKDGIYFSKILGNEGINEEDGEEQSGQASYPPLTWHPEQVFLTNTGNGTAILPFHNYALLIFTDRGIETYQPNNCDPLNPTINVVTRAFGTVSKHSCRHVGEDVFFVDLEGHVRSLAQTVTDESRGVTPRPISEPIADVIARVNVQNLKAVRAAVVRGGYLVGWPTGSSRYANEFWFFDLTDGSWQGPWTFKDNGAGSFLKFTGIASARLPHDNSIRERVWGLAKNAAGNARLYRMFSGRTDDSTTIPWRIVTRAHDGGAPDIEKDFQAASMRFRFLTSAEDAAVTVTLRARVDERAWQSMGSKTFSPDATPTISEAAGTPVIAESAGTPVLNGYTDQIDTWPLTGLGVGRTLQLEFSISESASSFEILSIFCQALVNNVKLEH